MNSFFKNISNIPDIPNFFNLSFNSIINLPKNVYVHDFTTNNSFQNTKHLFSIGKYNEERPNMYTGDLFEKSERFIHMGLDIGAPIKTAVKSFYVGEIFLFAYNKLKLDYGYTIITKHRFGNQNMYALYGHLSESSIKDKKIGQKFDPGETLGFLGNKQENGGWPPHVHFQLSLIKPNECNLPGVVSKKDHKLAQKIFPDPRLVLGELY